MFETIPQLRLKQRAQYKLDKLSQDRYERLCQLQFDFRGKPELKSNTTFFKGNVEEHWEKRIRQLIEFKRKHGHCYVKVITAKMKKRLPPGKDYGLGGWLQSQNLAYNKGELSQERYDRLRDIGYEFHIGIGTSREDTQRWETRFQELVAYKEANGHCDVPYTLPENPLLSTWAKTQVRWLQRLKLSWH